MGKRKNNNVSDFEGSPKTSVEWTVRECFLRTVKETLDSQGVETWTIQQIQGATMMLEKFIELRQEHE